MSKVQNLRNAGGDPLHTEFHEQNIREGSITPDTLLTKDFAFPYTTSAVIGNTFVPRPDDFYVGTYQHKGTTTAPVAHFGINVYTHQTIISPLPPPLPTSGTSTVSSGKKSASVVDLKTNAQSFSASCMTDQEKYLCSTAIEYLSANPTSHQAVVLDIFVRNPDKSIKMIQKTVLGTSVSVPEVHCVVLYKQPCHSTTTGCEFLVIDPSNNTFSYILTAAHQDIRLCFTNDPMQIYKPGGKPGPMSWRDCLDIAIKLSFCLGANKDAIKVDTTGTISSKSLEASASIKDITNQQTLYEFLPKISGEYPIRAHQSSDVKEVKLMTFCLKQTKKLMEQIEGIIEQSGMDLYHLTARIEQKCMQLLTENVDHAQHIHDLQVLCTKLTNLKDHMNANPLFIEEQECAIIGDAGAISTLLP